MRMDKMKKLALVRLRNEQPYKNLNLTKDMRGILVELNVDNAKVLFFNPQNIGDYAIIAVRISDLILENEKLPTKFQRELLPMLDSMLEKSKNYIEPIKIKEYDMVELIVEDEKYAKYGIHKGDKGCVMDNNAVKNYIQVDFSGIDKDGNFYGDCISVKIDDLKVTK
jgi:hypothetical protein